MTKTLPDAPTLPGLALIEGIDMDAEVQCGHSQHLTHHADEPAAYIVRNQCPCGGGATYPLCESGWRRFVILGYSRCTLCGDVRSYAEAVWIIEYLR